MTISLFDVAGHRRTIGDEIDRAVIEAVERGEWIMGSDVAELEQSLSNWIGDPDLLTVTCGNGTDALQLGALALGLEAGQGVICPAFTFVATAEAIALVGGTPVFADVDLATFTLDPDSAAAAIASARDKGVEVVGVVAVDLFGQPADYARLSHVAAKSGCWLMSDAAQSFGATCRSGPVGTLADVTTTSFFPTKPFACYGDGGALFTKDRDLAEALRSLRIHGKGRNKYDNVRIGMNSRLDTIQAAVLSARLEILSDELARRAKVAGAYTAALSDHVDTPGTEIGSRSSWALYTIRSNEREELREWLSLRGVDSAVYYDRLLPDQPAYQAYSSLGPPTPQAAELAKTVLSLPMHPYLSEEHVGTVISSTRSFFDRVELETKGDT